MRHNILVENWRRFLTEKDTPALEQIPDEALLAIFSKEITALLQDKTLNEVESLETKAKRLAKKYGLPIALAMGILTGTAADMGLNAIKSAGEPSGESSYFEPGQFLPSGERGARQLPPGYSDLSNEDAMETAWKVFERRHWQAAPVDGSYPLIRHGEVVTAPFAYVPIWEINDWDILPMSLITAGEYREFLAEKIRTGSPQEVIYLKKMIYGDTAKWLSGDDNSDFRFLDDLLGKTNPMLPPEWTIAHDVYATEVERRAHDILEHLQQYPEDAPRIAAEMGLENPEQIPEYMNRIFYGIQR